MSNKKSLKIQFSTKPKPNKDRHPAGGYYWKESEAEYLKRNFSKEQIKKIKQLRKIPDTRTHTA